MYDLIGDIHGYADPLRRLLEKMGYTERQGIWSHPERKVIFLGDFIDRGPAQLEVVDIARNMVDSGHALAVMGNHEFNAVAWATPNPDNPNQFLRAHTDKNLNQHKKFLAQIGSDSEKHHDVLAWFKSLPLFLDLEGLRVVHACWHPEALKLLSQYTDDQNRILDDAWPALALKQGEGYDALETILKGVEIPLPSGYSFHDKQGDTRKNIRIRWWKNAPDSTYRELALVPSDAIDSIPMIQAPANELLGYDGHKPLFLGHYWLTGQPTLLSDHIACLDYSIAAEDIDSTSNLGKLCAYRWDGESKLSADKFIWVT